MDIHVSTIGHSHHPNSSIIFFVCLTAALAGLLFGLDIGVIAGALPFITKTFTLSSAQQEWIVSTMMFGATVGAIISGWLSAQWGRKYSLMIGAILFVIGSLCAALSPTIEALIVARMILGLAVGIASYTAPLYLSEISPENIRGSMISMYQLMITIGILVAYLSDAFFSYHQAWRWMLGVITIPALLLLVGVYFLPRSPRWLVSNGHGMKAKAVLKRLRNTSNEAQRELEEIQKNLKATQSSGWTLFKQNSNFRRAVYLGILLQVMQQFTGMNIIMYYAPKIFGLAGFAGTTQQIWGSVIVGLVNVLATFIAIAVVDRRGRKPTMIIGFTVMAIGMGLLGIMMWIGIDSIAAQYFTIVMLLMFIVGFAMSAGPLVWVLCSEIQPLKGRDFGITCSTTTNWIANMVVGATFLTMLGTLGSAYTFWVYAGLNILFILLTLALIPETKNLSLEQIERNLMSGKPLRHLGSKEAFPLEEINRQSNLKNFQHKPPLT